MAMLRLEDGQSRCVLTGISFSLGSVARPQANGLNTQEIVVAAGRCAGLFLRLRRQTSNQANRQKS
jgi:hypothetical protein